jgi:hypothetical protein
MYFGGRLLLYRCSELPLPLLITQRVGTPHSAIPLPTPKDKLVLLKRT